MWKPVEIVENPTDGVPDDILNDYEKLRNNLLGKGKLCVYGIRSGWIIESVSVDVDGGSRRISVLLHRETEDSIYTVFIFIGEMFLGIALDLYGHEVEHKVIRRYFYERR